MQNSNYFLVKEIPHIIHTLTEGSPADQKNALETYFNPNASFVHPFCRVPSFSKASIPLIGMINSRWVIWMIYRWYKILSPRIVLDVHSVGKSCFPFRSPHVSYHYFVLMRHITYKVYDQKQQILYVSISQVFSIFFVPFYAPKVNLVTVLNLSHDTANNKSYIDSQQDLYQLNEFVKFVWPGGATLLLLWQWMNTLLSIMGALVLAPMTWVEEKVAERKKV
jgi:hypothetical protein